MVIDELRVDVVDYGKSIIVTDIVRRCFDEIRGEVDDTEMMVELLTVYTTHLRRKRG